MEKRILYDKDYFESDAHTFSNIERTSLYFEPIIYSLNSCIKPSRILDIGCAKGFLVFLFHSLEKEAYGVDKSSYAINNSPEEVRERLFILDVEKNNLPFPDNYFDLITLIDVLEHLRPISLDHLLGEIKRVSKPNCYICATFPTKKAEKRDPTHIILKPKSFWISLFKGYNFLLAEKEQKLLKKESQKYIWNNKLYFIKLYRKLLKNTPPSTTIGKFLGKAGSIGNIIREIFWLSNYFFCHSRFYFNQKMVLFKKTI
jgi:SAM-dependent methyltransferase